MTKSTRKPDAFTIFIALAALASGGVALLTGMESSPTVHAMLPDWVGVWNLCLTFGGLTGIGSLLARRFPVNALLERLSAGFLGILFLVYGVAICIVDSTFFSTASGVIFAASLAALYRCWVVHTEIRTIRRELRELGKARCDHVE